MTEAPLIEAAGLEVRFGRMKALDDVSLQLGRGETVALVGESGSGKTTLGRALLGLVGPSAGAVRHSGRDVATFDRHERLRFRRLAQMIFQDPIASLSPRMSIGRLVREPLRIHRLDAAAGEARLAQLLATLALPPAVLAAYPHQISGGQARRIGILRALMVRPALLVADEPTAGLDVSVQGELLNLLAELRRSEDLGYLLISHNLPAVRRVADRVAVLYLGQVVETGNTRAVFDRPAHPYTAALLSAVPAIDPAIRRKRILLAGEIPSPATPPAGCRFHTRCPQAQARCAIDPPVLRPRGAERQVRCHFPLD